MVHGFSCPTASGIFLAQGLNPCPLHLQADSYPLHHQGSLPALSLRIGPRSPGSSLLLNSMGQCSHRASPESWCEEQSLHTGREEPELKITYHRWGMEYWALQIPTVTSPHCIIHSFIIHSFIVSSLLLSSWEQTHCFVDCCNPRTQNNAGHIVGAQ